MTMQAKTVGRVSAPKRARRRKTTRGGTSKKMAVSFEFHLAADIQRAAKQGTGGNVSAWLALAAADRIRQDNLAGALAWMEEKNGPSTPEEMARAERLWPKG
ncbi:MAG: hypothetical protein ABJA82_18395 [Myxococcales bacterium]